MVQITDSVGDGGANAKHDVAIIQLMLRLITNAKGAAYLATDYTGTYGDATKNAIVAFQTDQKIPTTAPALKQPTDPPVEKSGVVALQSGTFAKLTAALPAKYADIRIISETNTVYLPAAAAEAQTSSATIISKVDLDGGFRTKVAAVVDAMYARHAIVLEVVGPGWRRTFATQAAQTNTNAGPGESNHNFGRAVDLGFRGFRWVKGDGSFVTEGGWLGSNALGNAKSMQIWEARDSIALKEQGLFLSGYPEQVHLQSYADAAVSTCRSLAKLLTSVGAMKWQYNLSYKSDLSLGGPYVAAGTAKEIWANNSPIAAANVAAAAAGRKMPELAKNNIFKNFEAVKKAAKEIAEAKAGTKVPSASATLSAQDVTAADLLVLKTALKADFEKADTNWSQWAPVP